MPISHINKCVFVHIPRTGGTSFRKMLQIDEEKPSDLEKINSKGLVFLSNKQKGRRSYDTPRVLQKEHLVMSQMAQLNIVDRNIFNQYFKFAFVRNPWDKLLSEYTNHYCKYCESFEEYVSKVEQIVNFINDNFKFDIEDLFYEEYSKLTFNILWNKKLDNHLMPWGGNEVHSDPHFFPQHIFTHNLDGTVLVDFIGRFESYEEDAQNILNQLGISSPIEKLHSSEHPPYRQAYTPITRDIIANVFQTDIKVFGYQF